MAGVGRTKQWGKETLGDLWKGEGWGGQHGVYKMDTPGTFRKESREFELDCRILCIIIKFSDHGNSKIKVLKVLSLPV